MIKKQDKIEDGIRTGTVLIVKLWISLTEKSALNAGINQIIGKVELQISNTGGMIDQEIN